jgi:hypothetical protein
MPLQKEADPVLKKRTAADYITPSPKAYDLSWKHRDLSAPKNNTELVVMTRLK